jgi:hypothetical protein
MQPIANNLWMEITRREDIGADLKAPSAARGGGITASYVLVPVVRPDDVVIHYDSRREAIVGVSVSDEPQGCGEERVGTLAVQPDTVVRSNWLRSYI